MYISKILYILYLCKLIVNPLFSLLILYYIYAYLYRDIYIYIYIYIMSRATCVALLINVIIHKEIICKLTGK